MPDTSTHETGSRSYVETQLNYLVPSDEKPVYYAYDPPAGARRSGEFVPKTVQVRDGRPILDELSLDKQGFLLTRHDTAVRDFYDSKEVESVYFPEVERLLKKMTGASKVHIFDHVVRNASAEMREEKGARPPARTVHNDYSHKSGPQRVREFFPDEAETLLKSRFAEINVWRPIRGPLQDTTLAVCDARSIAPEDHVASDLVYQHRVGETYRFTYNPNHSWFYFPNMQRDEALLIKCYDSKQDGRARFTAHTAFDDPSSPPNAAPRESIEIRALVFWAPENNE